MMRELRKRMSVFLWLMAGAFILFIFLQWGMNISARKSGGENIKVIAKVNGRGISTQVYIEKLNNILNELRDSQNLTYIEPLTERIVEENAFEELIHQAIINEELRKNKIDIT
ncbi:SurA N-terminal domain-containing protein, partial [candidate division WOR-3 bacterium]|nr:SurA N-terminal domain-containing protein [candidate division WOR-3 bacterium]